MFQCGCSEPPPYEPHRRSGFDDYSVIVCGARFSGKKSLIAALASPGRIGHAMDAIQGYELRRRFAVPPEVRSESGALPRASVQEADESSTAVVRFSFATPPLSNWCLRCDTIIVVIDPTNTVEDAEAQFMNAIAQCTTDVPIFVVYSKVDTGAFDDDRCSFDPSASDMEAVKGLKIVDCVRMSAKAGLGTEELWKRLTHSVVSYRLCRDVDDRRPGSVRLPSLHETVPRRRKK